MINNKKKEEEEISITKPIIIVMTRWHAIYRCKNRLSQSIGYLQAALIQERLTNHTISVVNNLKKARLAEVQLAISGIGMNASRRWAYSKGIKKNFLQGEGSLGLRMRKQFLKVQSKNKRGRTTIIIGTDLPELCCLDLLKAIESLKRNEIVLGPAIDGGYWLMGLSERLVSPVVPSWPFSGISWGSNSVLKETIELAISRGISYELLKPQNDLDDFQDLFPWIMTNQK